MKLATTLGWTFAFLVAVGGAAVMIDVVAAERGSTLQLYAHYVSICAGLLVLTDAVVLAGLFVRWLVTGDRKGPRS